uniref:Serpentine Receptor, class H n=1 Tax=Caenorhabditis tropicalis TaxID=1561998 RepID=A0A1I7TSX2_9PELO
MHISILSTSSFLTTTLHLCTIISLPIHCLGTYCILFQSPNFMNSNFPDIPLSTHADPVFIASLDYRFILYPMVLIDSWNLIQTVILWALLHVNMVKLGKRIAISNQTYLLQKKFLQALTIQITVPFCILSFPIFYLTYSITNSFYSQAMNNLCVILVSLHGWITGIIMLFIHESFRRFCLGLVFQPKIEVQRNVSESIKSTVQ